MVLGKIDKYFNYAILAGLVGGFIYLGGFTGIGKKLGTGLTKGSQAFADTIKFPTFNLFGSDLSSVTSENLHSDTDTVWIIDVGFPYQSVTT